MDANTNYFQNFEYDLNGNLTKNSLFYNYDDSVETYYLWDESNRLRVLVDKDSTMHHYIYDASGERVLKASSNYESVYQNGTLTSPTTTTMNGYTTYPSAFMVINPDGVYSKHYYAGSQRIVSKLGNATAALFDTSCTSCTSCPSNNGNSRLATAANKKADNKTLQQAQMNDLQQYADLAEKGKVAYKEYSPNLLEDQEKALENEKATQDPKNTTARMALAQTPPSGVGGLYYYHPDHLGTSTFLTDANGVAYQFFLNLPFGETMAEQLGTSYYKSPYKFNGKELDQETGLYYYGARYYDPKTSLWLSIDPLAEQGPELSPYCYAFDNPINLTDPDGRWPNFPTSFQNAFIGAVKGVVNSVKQKYNETKAAVVQAKDNVVRTTNQVLNNGQKFVKKHKEQLVAGAKFIQKNGDNMTTTGLAAAAVGAIATAPAGGEGGAPGIVFAGFGAIVSGAGKVIEVGVKLIAEDPEAAIDGATYVFGEMASLATNQLLHIPQSATPFEKNLIKLAKEATENLANDKTVSTIKECKE